jgi:hypothetical protein
VLVQLIYASTPTTDVQLSAIDIVSAACHNNAENGITGLLVSGQTYYLQLLEGERLAVNALYQRIVKDDRHTGIVLLRYSEIREREFGEWSMTHLPDTELSVQRDRISGAAALATLRRYYALQRVLLDRVVDSITK